MLFHYAAFVSLHFINKIKIFWKDMVYSWENAQVTVLFCHYIPNFILLGMDLTVKHTYLNTTLYHLTNKKHINFSNPFMLMHLIFGITFRPVLKKTMLFNKKGQNLFNIGCSRGLWTFFLGGLWSNRDLPLFNDIYFLF